MHPLPGRSQPDIGAGTRRPRRFPRRLLHMTALLAALLEASACCDARGATPAAAPAAAVNETQQRQERFRTLVTGVTLVGRFTIDRGTARQPDPAGKAADAAEKRDDAPAKDAKPPAELPLRDEEYLISGAVPLGGDLWVITARIRYGDKDVTVPVPVAVKWAGDTPVITLDTITIPGLGTFSSRVVLDGARYAGTWQHDDVGGHMFGRIERPAQQ